MTAYWSDLPERPSASQRSLSTSAGFRFLGLLPPSTAHRIFFHVIRAGATTTAVNERDAR
jgi:hypothetical protein